jgi:C-terminal processing protease CtpA/Prc
LFAAGLTVTAAANTAAQARPDSLDGIRSERLAALARVWGIAKFFHPSLGDAGAADWDSALVATLPAVRAARDAREFGVAVDNMLATLDDPLTRVDDSASGSGRRERRAGFHFTSDSILVITAGDYYELFSPAVVERISKARGALARARGVVFDLRPPGAVDPFGRMQLEAAFAPMQRLLVTEPIVTGGRRRRVYYGYASPSPFSSGQYRSGTVVEDGTRIVPARGARGIPVVYLVDEHAELLSSALPLQAAGRARIVYSGTLRRHSMGEVTRVPLGGGLTAQVRTSDPLLADGRRAWLQPDAVIADTPGTENRALDSAIALARAFTPSPVRHPTSPAVAAAAPERAYAESEYPPVEYRLLAAIRAWNVIEHFYPYKSLLDTAWSDVLPAILRDFEAARDAPDYGRAVARLASRLSDAHAYVAGPAYERGVVDDGYPPIRVRVIEGQPIVTRIFDTTAARSAGISIGDVVQSVDGTPAPERLRALEQLTAAATSHDRTNRAALTFMNGPPGSMVRLGLTDAAGRRKEAVLERRHEDVNTLYHRERAGEIVRILPGNVGYVDLDRLTLDMLDSMFTRLARTRAIIFDMRGYPTGTIWAIAPRLTDSARIVARLETPLVGHNSPAPGVDAFHQVVEPAPVAQRYRGRVLMLMDERSVSQAEHTGLYLKAVSGATFVGSPTAGTNGEITTISLPGGLTMGFTGQAVTFPDGRQLQRVGLIPDFEVRPTVAGIRAGRDEVLEAALQIAGRE